MTRHSQSIGTASGCSLTNRSGFRLAKNRMVFPRCPLLLRMRFSRRSRSFSRTSAQRSKPGARSSATGRGVSPRVSATRTASHTSPPLLQIMPSMQRHQTAAGPDLLFHVPVPQSSRRTSRRSFDTRRVRYVRPVAGGSARQRGSIFRGESMSRRTPAGRSARDGTDPRGSGASADTRIDAGPARATALRRAVGSAQRGRRRFGEPSGLRRAVISARTGTGSAPDPAPDETVFRTFCPAGGSQSGADLASFLNRKDV